MMLFSLLSRYSDNSAFHIIHIDEKYSVKSEIKLYGNNHILDEADGNNVLNAH